jgi:nucleotide-binding universal stress UspA family protein
MNASHSFILCATDFSAQAADAATVAAKIALRRGERLRLVHAAESPSGSVQTLLRNRLSAEVERLKREGAEAEPLLLTGSVRPSDGLLTYIRDERPDLIVVGCAVKGPLDRWALGSFSERIAESAPIPTLVVRNPSVFASWDWNASPLRILLALDFYSSSDVVLRWAKQFRRMGPCDLIACHVNWRMPHPDEPSLRGQPVDTEAKQHRLERDLRKKVRDQIGDNSIEVIVRPYFGDPGPCIVEIATDKQVHVIAIGAHQRKGLHRVGQFSVSREVLHQSAINVICVPITTQFDAREAHIPDFHRVLVATDFSEVGNTAVPFACAACCIGGLVKIVHVAPSRVPTRHRAGVSWSSDLREHLRALIPNETGARCQPPVVAVLENDNVARAICAEADRFGADLVCMASHGFGASKALHGSVTKNVMKRLRRPLLVVQHRED